jgi:hypothetical protein
MWTWCASYSVHMCYSRVRPRNHSNMLSALVEMWNQMFGSMQGDLRCMLVLCCADGSLQNLYLQLVS